MGVKHTVLPDGQPQTVACTVLAQLCVPQAKETKMGVKQKRGQSPLFGTQCTMSNNAAVRFLQVHLVTCRLRRPVDYEW